MIERDCNNEGHNRSMDDYIECGLRHSGRLDGIHMAVTDRNLALTTATCEYIELMRIRRVLLTRGGDQMRTAMRVFNDLRRELRIRWTTETTSVPNSRGRKICIQQRPGNEENVYGRVRGGQIKREAKVKQDDDGDVGEV
jgi:hypothetical protein